MLLPEVASDSHAVKDLLAELAILSRLKHTALVSLVGSACPGSASRPHCSTHTARPLSRVAP
jgi:hypothetical protein